MEISVLMYVHATAVNGNSPVWSWYVRSVNHQNPPAEHGKEKKRNKKQDSACFCRIT